VGPGNIFGQRPLPVRPIQGKGVLSAVTKLLGRRENAMDLHGELWRVADAFRKGASDQARLRLRRIVEALNEIKRSGSQFVLNQSDWRSIHEMATRALQTASQTSASHEMLVMLRTIETTLEAFVNGKLDQAS
jgi:hypothetical protein